MVPADSYYKIFAVPVRDHRPFLYCLQWLTRSYEKFEKRI